MSDSDSDSTMASADVSLEKSGYSGSIESDLKSMEERKADSYTQSYQGESAATLASQRVGLNQDILPLILEHLSDGPTKSWRKAFVPLLVVNRSFFQCSADVLWGTMDSLEPAFKLLPWYKNSFGGLGLHVYSSRVDWNRFETYSPRIRSLNIRSMSMSTVSLVQMLMLPGRPDPLFPSIQAIYFGPSHSPKQQPILSFLVSPSLRSLGVEEERSLALNNALSVLPTLSTNSPGLKSIKLSGPLREDSLVQLSQVTSITSLELIFTNNIDLCHLRQLQHPPLLNSLSISAPHCTSLSPRLTGDCLENHGRLLALSALDVKATPYQQCLIVKAISPRNLRRLTLTILPPFQVTSGALYICLSSYFYANYYLSELLVTFNSITTGSVPTPPHAGDVAVDALAPPPSMSSLRIHDIPLDTAASTSPLLIPCIPSWPKLTCLSLRVALPGSETPEESTPPSTPPFPGPSMLAQIWRYCPNMEELEYHLDKDLVAAEDLTESLTVCDSQFACAAAAGSQYPSGHHRLRKLCINTGRTTNESKELQLSMSRKIQIATFLDRLFPTLEVVGGSASETWDEVVMLVRAFQDQRARLETLGRRHCAC